MASRNKDQWGRPHPPTQPQGAHPTGPYQWSPTTLTSDQLARSARPYQPTVEDVADESRTYHDVDQVQIFPHSQLPFPNSNITYSSFGDYDYPTNLNMSARRSTHPFAPPSLCSDSSTLSSASSNFSIGTPTSDQQCRRRSSQQAFLEREGQEALARANKRMATGMSTTSPFCKTSTDVWSGWGRTEAPYPPNGIGRDFTPQFPDSLESDRTAMHVTYAPTMQDAFSNSPFQTSNFSPRQQQRKLSRSSVHVHPPVHTQDVRAQNSPSASYTQPRTPTSPTNSRISTSPSSTQASVHFETFLESELHRRSIADKTIRSIRSVQARAVAQSKEDVRRTDWAKEVLLKFPIESAMCESLNPGSMMRAVAADGVFDMSAGLAR